MAPTSTPARLGRYELLFPLASGGMATVYLARKRGPGGFESRVAVKLTHAHLREQPEWVTGLLHEAKIAARIRHPNVVQILDVDDDEHGVFLVMEYVEGDSLAALMRKVGDEGSRVPMPIALRVIDDALAGLHSAHTLKDEGGRLLGVVHRDFSPQNILVGADGTSRLTDFGIAKVSQRAGLTRTGVVKGKLAYMSPEQAQGQSVDRRADVWSAGVVAWELLSGERLFADENEAATLLRIISKPAPRLRSVRPDVPPALDDAVAQALEIDPARRPPTAEAFRARLRDAFSEIAEPAEVSAYMMRVVGPQVAERRARAASLPEIPDGRTSKPVIMPPAPLGATEIAHRRRVPQIVAAAFGVTLAVIVVGILLAGRAISSARARAVASASAVPSAAPVDPAPVALPPAQASPPRAQSELHLTANAPIARVVINGRAVAADPAAREVAVVLDESEEEVALRITATAADGRVARANVPAGTREAAMAFRKSAASAASAPVAPAPPPATTAPKLHPSPYASGP